MDKGLKNSSNAHTEKVSVEPTFRRLTVLLGDFIKKARILTLPVS
jgi:hypothetical protein